MIYPDIQTIDTNIQAAKQFFFYCSKYTDQRVTAKLHVSYYVKPDFLREYQGSVRRLEHQVEEDYISVLRNGCYKERNHSE